MRTPHFACMTVLAALPFSTAAAAGCQLQRLGDLPVEMHGLRPVVSTKINGAAARFELDSGAFYSTMSRDAAVHYQLPITPIRGGSSFYISGAGGREEAHLATVQSFEFLGVPLSRVQFLVIDQHLSNDSVVGLIGQNLLRISDVEFDLPDGVVRFFKPVDCADQPLAYWATNTTFTSVDLKYRNVSGAHLAAAAAINGHRVTVWFDTGANRSVLSLDAARRAGITPDSPGVTFLGLSQGIGPAPTQMWSAPVDTFQLGGEKVQHTHLLIGNLEPPHQAGELSYGMPDMLLGEDFFLSHRIYVAYSQSKLYFTYNGGALFNLDVPHTQAATAVGPRPSLDVPTDADGFKRRGMAYAARHEYDLAITDLTHACNLAPKDAENHYDRGVIYARNGQYKSALEDFDAVTTLQPNDIDALLARAELLHRHPEAAPAAAATQIKSDLDAVSRLAAPAADTRLTLGDLYGRIGDYAAAIGQVDQWLSQHPLKNDQAIGLNSRCWLRAAGNQDLHEALDDCNHALDLRQFASATIESRIRTPLAPENPDILDSRGLVYLRLGSLKEAIRDYDSALQINANMSTSLYGRGLAELRLGEKTQGQDDVAAAEKLDSGIAHRFATMGLAP